ncbi:hypothetical protein CYJ66_04610 [Gardnerella vaginalis]|nr:hypothetical protein CYJ58_03145 [Gardnerella vaginalis]PKZ45815.1 hypothetical protein CYJ68_01965 [Gardnerella vaginalis]PKZ47523.1 hypothetical protein CYJ67_01915 [Gardnerella vaginalis]PKZ54027.1 hypothetical protein CYJ66_04610 [Gardnerella vaginalis]PKZ56138.1 hypothetical protein CYJ64_04610 [Gardnerella vaginalis]
MVAHWIVWYRLPLLYCSTKNHPALLHARTFAYLESPPHLTQSCSAIVPNLRRVEQQNPSHRSHGLAARTSSLALKAHRAFNLKQAQRSELPSRATL